MPEKFILAQEMNLKTVAAADKTSETRPLSMAKKAQLGLLIACTSYRGRLTNV